MKEIFISFQKLFKFLKKLLQFKSYGKLKLG